MSTSKLWAARWLCVALVNLVGLATFAPIAALADTDLTIGGTAVVANTEGAGATLRKSPSYDAEVLRTVSEGTRVNVTDGPVSGGGSLWYAATVSGEAGYLPAIFLTSSSSGPAEVAPAEPTVESSTAETNDAPVVVAAAAATGSAVIAGTNGDGVRCRTEPSYAGSVITVVPEGTTISLNGAATGEWQPTSCNGSAGFVHTDFVRSGGEAPPALPDVSTEASVGAETSVQAAAATGYSTVTGTNGDGLRCRSAASYSASTITVLPEGASVALRGSVQGEWQPVVCAGSNGFAHASFIGGSGAAPTTPQAPSTDTGSSTVSGYTTVTGTNGEGLRCRSAASYSASTITVLPEGTSVAKRGGATGEWQPVLCAGMNGFAHASFLGAGGGTAAPSTPQTPSAPDTGSNTVTGYTTVTGTNGEGLRCRSATSYSSSTITVMPEGTSVAKRGSAQGEWQPVVCAGMNGFAHTSFLGAVGAVPQTPQAPAPTATPAPVQATPPPSSGFANGAHAQVTSSLNLRYSPDYSSGVAAVAEAGTVVLITGSAQNGFYPIDWDGLRGFMHGDYLTVTNAALSERGGSAPAPQPAAPEAPPAPSGSGSSIAGFALQYQGYPYVWATSGPASFDCSGFTYWVIKNTVGVDIGRGLFTQVAAGTPVSRGNLQPGDLVFFQNTYTWGLSHSGLYIGNGQFIHAENETTGVKISDINSTYYSSRWYGAVRL